MTISARHSVLFLGATGLLVAGCGPDITIVSPPEPTQLFGRVHQFLTISLMLLNERTLWGQAISNAYYAALSLARFQSDDFFGDSAEQFHERVWSHAPKDARKYFRDELHRLRIKYDYQFVWPEDEGPEDDLRDFAKRAPAAFDLLLADASTRIERTFRGCSELHKESPKDCLLCDRKRCRRRVMTDELQLVRARLDELFQTAIPNAIGQASRERDAGKT